MNPPLSIHHSLPVISPGVGQDITWIERVEDAVYKALEDVNLPDSEKADLYANIVDRIIVGDINGL